MSYGISGLGNVGQALANALARKGIEVSVATARDPERFAAYRSTATPDCRI